MAATCEKGAVEWMATYLGECVYSPLQIISVAVGLLSICCWLVAQGPQIYTNYKLKEADSLSFFFLLQWFLGDITNLLGCLFSKQNATQTFTAVYYVSVDCLLFGQFLYYTQYRKWRRKRRDRGKIQSAEDGAHNPRVEEVHFAPEERGYSSVSSSRSGSFRNPYARIEDRPYSPPGVSSAREKAAVGSAPVKRLLSLGIVLLAVSSVSVLVSGFGSLEQNSQHDLLPSAGSRVLMGKPPPPSEKDWMYYVGQTLGYISAVLYLGSRVPQLVKNVRRKSTEGLSPVMFTMAVMGNCTYAVSIFLYDQDSGYLLARTAWILGSVGTLCFDFTALTQFLYYKKEAPIVHEEEDQYVTDYTDYSEVDDLPEGEYGDRIKRERHPLVKRRTERQYHERELRKAYYGRIGIGVPGPSW